VTADGSSPERETGDANAVVRPQKQMPMHVALLRGINVGGRTLIAMRDLRQMFEALGFAGAKSWLQSGNVVFRSDRRKGAALERLLESETEKRLGASIHYCVRDVEELDAVIARNPFPREAQRDPSHLVVVFLKKTPDSAALKKLEAAIRGPETFRADGKQLYVVYPAGIGDSKFTGALIERTLGSRGTARNWNTVLKLAALAGE
jgi:uncharacterized protein (DUF1697 family)